MSRPVDVGVVGVGQMGSHHARVYNELCGANLVGVADADQSVAEEVAAEYETAAMETERLLARADAVSLTVPTRLHAEFARRAVDAGTAALVEKPFVRDLRRGREVADHARSEGVPLQVGHIERFNPAVVALQDVLPEIEPIAVSARRQGPPVDRDSTDSAVMDLMIHDIDILLSIASAPLEDVSAVSTREGRHVCAQLSFADGLIGSLTASRVTEQKIRSLSITAGDCQVNVGYLDRSLEIHRHSLPEFVSHDGNLRYRHESIIERPTVSNGEPLKRELESFLTAVREGEEPAVTPEDGLRAVAVAREIEAAVGIDRPGPEPEPTNP
jgi:predicted dehydrogenase